MVRLWDLSAGIVVSELVGHSGFVEGVAFSPDGKLLASGGIDRSVRLWDPETGREVLAIRGRAAHVRDVAFSPDSALLIWGSWDKTVRVWDIAEGRERHCLRGKYNGVMRLECVAGESGESVVAVGTYDGKVALWNPVTGESAGRALAAHDAAVFGVAFSTDPEMLITASWDGTVKLWGGRAKRPLKTFDAHAGGVGCVAVRPGGCVVASGGQDTMVKLWDLSILRARSVSDGERVTGAWLVGFEVEPLPKYRFANALPTDPFLQLRWSPGHPNHWLPRAREGDAEAMHRLAVIRERQSRDGEARRLHVEVTRLRGEGAQAWAEESQARLARLPWLQSADAWEEARVEAVAESSRAREPERWRPEAERGVRQAMLRLAVLLERDGTYEEARDLRRRLVAGGDAARDAWGARARERLDALPWLRDPDLYRVREEAQSRLRAEDVAGASRLCKQLAETKGEEGERLSHDLAQALCARARGLAADAAEDLLVAAVEICPSDIGTRRNLAEVLDKRGKRGEAVRHLREGAALEEVPARVLWAVGCELSGLGDFEGGKAALERALAADSTLQGVRIDLGLLHVANRDLGEAMVHFTRFAQNVRDSSRFATNRVTAFLSREPGSGGGPH